MFDKLNARERKLAFGVLALAPATLVFVAIFWFLGQYDANNKLEASLNRQVNEEKFKLELGKKAERRRAYYDSISLPADLEDAGNDYQAWMKGLVRDELQMDLKAFTPTDASDLKLKTTVIGQRKYYMLRADGNLDQLTRLLSRFYSVDLLHRINSLKVIAQNETGGSKKKIRTGILSITAKIEVLALNSAVDYEDFLQRSDALRGVESKFAEANDAYRQMVLKRDIFGPPNNTPTLSATPKSSYESETEATISLAAKDADEEDQFSIEIVESQIEGWELDQSESGGRSAKLIVPGQKAGRYKFTAKITDNGFPAKESTEEFTVTFKDKVVATPDPPKKPDPPFINAKETQITGIVLEKSGDWRVWIKVRTTGDRYKLKVGESFELDDKKWVVEEIKPREAVLRVENKLLTFQPTDRFVNPRKEVTLEVPVTEAEQDTQPQETSVRVESDSAPKPRTSTL